MYNFSLDDTLDCGQAFRWVKNPDESYTGVYKNKVLDISKNNDTVILKNTTIDEYNEIWKEYFDFDTDYAKIKEILSANPVLKAACEYAPGIRVLKQDSWEALCSFIISQNNNIKRIKGIVKNLCESFGEPLGNGFFSFPAAEKIATLTIEDLAPLKCGFRNRYIIDAAQKVANGEVDFTHLKTLPLEEAEKELMKIVGVGIKVADCTLLYGFYRLDAFPKDVWIKKAMTELLPEGLPEYAKAYAGIAQQYIFHYIRTANINI